MVQVRAVLGSRLQRVQGSGVLLEVSCLCCVSALQGSGEGGAGSELSGQAAPASCCPPARRAKKEQREKPALEEKASEGYQVFSSISPSSGESQAQTSTRASTGLKEAFAKLPAD